MLLDLAKAALLLEVIGEKVLPFALGDKFKAEEVATSIKRILK